MKGEKRKKEKNKVLNETVRKKKKKGCTQGSASSELYG